MIQPFRVTVRGRERSLVDFEVPLSLDDLVPVSGPWEVEIGFGRGSYLVRRAAAGSGRFLGVEVVSKYYQILNRRARHWQLDNLVIVRCEAQYLISALLPRQFAAAVHVYFPDPWPKHRHRKRRLFDDESVDLVLGLLAPEGRLFFATDHQAYGRSVLDTLSAVPGLVVERVAGPWPDGPRTNYEVKYEAEGREILRLAARIDPEMPVLHPRGEADVVCALR